MAQIIRCSDFRAAKTSSVEVSEALLGVKEVCTMQDTIDKISAITKVTAGDQKSDRIDTGREKFKELAMTRKPAWVRVVWQETRW